MAAKTAQPPAVRQQQEIDKIPARIDEIMVPVLAYKESITSALRRQTHTNITYDDLVADLKSALRMNFKLRSCDKNSIAGCAVYAARRGLSFGEGGVHLVPRKRKGSPVEHASPIIDYRAKRAICERVLKLRLTARLVYQAEEQRGEFEMEHGLNPVFRHKTTKLAKERDPDNIFGGYWFAEYQDGRKEFDFVDTDEIQKHFDVSAAGNKGPWGSWRKKMILKTLIIIGANTLMGNYTGGGVDTPDLDWEEDAEAIEAEFEELGPVQEGEGQPQSQAMADELAAQKAPKTADLGPQKEVTIPALPEDMGKLMSDYPTFDQAAKSIRSAYDNLMEDDQALSLLWGSKKNEWGNKAPAVELKLITQVKLHYFARALSDGFPQASEGTNG